MDVPHNWDLPLKTIGREYSKKFLRLFIVEALLAIIPLILFFGIAGLLQFFHANDTVMGLVILGMATFLILVYLPIALWLFFRFPKQILQFPPFPNTAVQTERTLQESVQTVFGSVQKEGKRIFDVQREDHTMRITWSADVFANQLLAVSGVNSRHIFMLTFYEKSHTMKVVQRDVKIRWSASWLSFFAGLQFSQGVFAEFEREFIPAVEFLSDTTMRFDVQRIRYNANEIIKPLMYLVARSGWRIQFGILN